MTKPYLFILVTALAGLAAPSSVFAADLEKRTEGDWKTYVAQTESRIAGEFNGSQGFLIRNLKPPEDAAKILKQLKKSEVYVEKMQTTDARKKNLGIDGGIAHHWYGSIFIPDMTTARLLRWIQNYNDHRKYFKEVEQSELKSAPDRFTFDIHLQLVRTKVLTVRYDTDHHVTFQQRGPGRVSSTSISTRIQEIEDADATPLKLKPAGRDNGYFWRTNAYWRYEEADGGVFVECESLSLSRSIPFGLGFVIGRFVESVPRESLESMLTSIRDGARSAPR